MVKLTGPGLSTEASGSLNDQLTFTNWKGKAYAKRHRKPKQPRTDAQRTLRAMMSFLSRGWAACPPAARATWEPLAAETNIAPFNAYQAGNLDRWQEFNYPSQAYPATEAGVLPSIAGWTVTPRPQALHHSILITDVKDGWAIGLFHHHGAFGADKQEYLYHFIVLTTPATYTYTMRNLTPGGSHKLWLTMITTTGRWYTPGLFETQTVPP